MMLYEKYAPKVLENFVGNADAIARLRKVIDRPDFDGAFFLIHGPSGCGKTTLANILAARFAGQAVNIQHLNGDECRIEEVQAMVERLNASNLWGGMRCVIVNEAHEITAKALESFKSLLDRRPKKTLIALTTDRPEKLGGIGDAMFSRPLKVKLETGPRELDEFATYLAAIAKVEGYAEGRSLEDFKALVNARKFNLRDCLTVIEMDDWADALALPDPELSAAADLNKG